MEKHNLTRIPELAISTLPMERYDKLPAALRRALQDAPYNLSINPVRLQNISNDGKEILEELQSILPVLIRSGATDAYGPDHPQAK